MLVVGEHAGKHISDFSGQFQGEFVALLSRRFGTKRVRANQVYQEYIGDKFHLHMNSTRWVTLTEFIKHLGRTGVARVDETEKGWFIAWIDSSPKALAKAEASMAKERATTSDEQRERLHIAEQIERAAAEASTAGPSSHSNALASSSSSTTPPPTVEEGLKRAEGTEKVVLSFATKAATTPSATASTAPGAGILIGGGNALKMNPLKAKVNPLKANPLKANPLKRRPEGMGSGMSAAQRVMVEDQEWKRRKMERESGGVGGASREA